MRSSEANRIYFDRAADQLDLHENIPHGDGQTILREAMLIADHNAYHLGQMVLLLKFFGSW